MRVMRTLCEDPYRFPRLAMCVRAFRDIGYCICEGKEISSACRCTRASFEAGKGSQYADEDLEPGEDVFHFNMPIVEDARKCTLLQTACRAGNSVAAKLLIRKGANPNHRDARGNTCLHYAFEYGHSELAAWLIRRHRADDGLSNLQGMSVHDGLDRTERR